MGLERLLRYCARPPFALERLELVGEHRVIYIYRLPRPRRDGCTKLVLTPLEFIDHLAALIPPPRLHRHRYHGVLAPNSPLRAAVVAYGRDKEGRGEAATPDAASTPTGEEKASRSPARYLWAMLLARNRCLRGVVAQPRAERSPIDQCTRVVGGAVGYVGAGAEIPGIRGFKPADEPTASTTQKSRPPP